MPKYKIKTRAEIFHEEEVECPEDEWEYWARQLSCENAIIDPDDWDIYNVEVIEE